MKLDSTKDIIEDIKQGKMVIIMDDADRENEGDLIMAADAVTPEAINFMARYGRGLICLTLTEQLCKNLQIPLMVQDNNAQHATNFTVSIEAAEGVTTGISAADRAITVLAVVADEAKPEDLVQPGHIFPLMAKPGGVLTRAGHTEAGCDFARLAGKKAAAVIVEILNEDGSMARRPDLELYAEQHQLKIGTIEDLIRYRIENEKAVERITVSEFPTDFGTFQLHVYRDSFDHQEHLALVKGEISPERETLVRVHVQNTLHDVIAGKQSRSWPLRDAMQRIETEGEGVIVIIRQNESLASMLEAADKTLTRESQDPPSLRTIGVGAQILADIGVRKMRLLSAPKKMHGLGGFGLEVVEYVSS
ncbi:MAG: 3,4-dihydroxy-2-butanone-4-phosphate synthase [Gammaproteobacteria bacterium]|nr:3,4-dihydroxy-2-butanone-4-phosphate synthase [Gammaproteobacteria bacterium]